MAEEKAKKGKHSQIRVCAMLDIVYRNKPKSAISIIAPGQAVPLWDEDPFRVFDTRLFLYSALSYKGKQFYTTIKGECLTAEGAKLAGREDAILGYGFGFHELRFQNSPVGTFCEAALDSMEAGVMQHPMKLVDFSRMAKDSMSSFDVHHDIIPTIYYPSPKKAVESGEDMWMWTPDKGKILMRKAPIPIVITPFNQLVEEWGYNPNMLSDWAYLYQGMVEQWCRDNKVKRLYVGHWSDPKNVEERLFSCEEYESRIRRVMKTVPYTYPDLWSRLDLHRIKVRLALRNQTLEPPPIYSGWV